jgi:hypothetical protein
MHLQYAERGGFTEHARPGRGIEFARAAFELQRI